MQDIRQHTELVSGGDQKKALFEQGAGKKEEDVEERKGLARKPEIFWVVPLGINSGASFLPNSNTAVLLAPKLEILKPWD